MQCWPAPCLARYQPSSLAGADRPLQKRSIPAAQTGHRLSRSHRTGSNISAPPEPSQVIDIALSCGNTRQGGGQGRDRAADLPLFRNRLDGSGSLRRCSCAGQRVTSNDGDRRCGPELSRRLRRLDRPSAGDLADRAAVKSVLLNNIVGHAALCPGVALWLCDGERVEIGCGGRSSMFVGLETRPGRKLAGLGHAASPPFRGPRRERPGL
jgi:hypothetical protein